ncbi:MAG: hypothetical protein IKP20_07455 [Candidatus Methanomethylophilaceae archaeon]|nr:hypothetical protein [Candidatus Methanomethylophilaceae archaeon]
MEVWRPANYIIFVRVNPKVIVDGAEVGKIKNGESIFFETTPGEHEIQVKALTTANYKAKLDLHEGSIIKVGTDVVGWLLEAVESKS